jgi:cytochrome P450
VPTEHTPGPVRDIRQFDILDSDYVQDIYGVFRRMQEEAPVTRVDTYGGHWVVTGYEAVLRAAQDWETFTSTQGPMFPDPSPLAHMPPITLDPPRHREFRRMINPYLSPQAVDRIEPAARAHAHDLIDRFVESGTCDLSRDFGEPFVPLVFFSDIVHVPKDLLPTFMERTVGTGHTPYEHSAALGELVTEFIELRRSMPGMDDVIDAILGARVDGRPLDEADVVGTALILLVGGTDTTRNVITTSLWYLAEHPELRSKLIEDPTGIPAVLEELLRLFGSVQLVGRTVTKGCPFEGVDLAPGDKVVLSMAAANRDPHEFPVPEELDMSRRANRHVAFGVGIHRCVGSHLARMEIRVALEAILARIPDYELAPGYRYIRRRGHVHGPESLPVVFPPRGARGGPGL